MIDFLTYLITGALVGLLYALIAMGFVVIYRASKVFNFAQGELVVFGGFVVWWMVVDAGLPLWAGLPLAFVVAAAFGLLIERIFFSKLVGESVFAMVMVTIGLLILMRGLILVLFGPAVRPFPIVFPLQPIFLGDILIPRSLLIGGIITVIVGFGLSYFFNRTRMGLRMTAVAEDHQVVIYLSGKSLNFLASEIGMTALPVALLAGFESIAGVLLAGIIVGVIQGLVTGYVDPAIGASFGTVVPFVIMLAILFIRPTGMFGWKTIERV
jgi:branched-chain amino acid transport system permease protein